MMTPASEVNTTNVTMTAGTSTTGTTGYTPPSSDADRKESKEAATQPTSSIPEPGKTFIIRDTTSGHVLTLLNGDVRLCPVGTRGSAYHWICHEQHGWLGFKNVAAGKYLGHDSAGALCATVPHHKGWERFCVRMVPQGGYVLLMTHWENLWPVKIKNEGGTRKLARVEAPVNHGLVWEFIEV